MEKGTLIKEGDILRFDDGSEAVITFDKEMKGNHYAWGIRYLEDKKLGLTLYLTERMLEQSEIVGYIL